MICCANMEKARINMWDQLSLQWRACVEQAWEAYRAGSIPIGAVITNPAGCILAAGHNRIYNSREVSPDHLSGSFLAHAEMNALWGFDHHTANPYECILYTTMEPCPMCAGAIVMVNLRQVHFAARDPWAGSTNLYKLSPYMSRKKVMVEGPVNLRLEAVLYALIIESRMQRQSLRLDGPTTQQKAFEDAMQLANPAGIALGRALYYEGRLQQMCAEAYPVREVIDLLDVMLEEVKLPE